MPQLPNNLEEAIEQALIATKTALDDGYRRVQVELLFPEIALRAQPIAQQFTSLFAESAGGLKVLFPDTGAAALARRDWGEVPFGIADLGSRRTPVDTQISSEDEAFLVVCPSAVEVAQVEKLANLADERPVVILIPQLEDVSIVGIGYAARQLRERFLNTVESCYYIQPLPMGAVFRFYPSPWQVWLEKDNDYELIAELPKKPVGEALEQIFAQAVDPSEQEGETKSPAIKKGLFSGLQQFLRALNQ